MEIRPAVRSDRDAVVATVVAAFADDPAFRFFFGRDQDRLAPLFVGYLFDGRVDHGGAWMTDDGSAVALWDPPGQQESAGAVDDRWRDFRDRLGEAAARLERYAAVVSGAVPPVPHWYLGVLASHPSRRGEGLARRVARHGLDAAATDGVPAVLETTNPHNVRLYTDSGWTRWAEIADVAPLTIWVLRYDHLPR